VEPVKTCEILVNLVIASTSAELIRAAVNGCSGASPVIRYETKTSAGAKGRRGYERHARRNRSPRLVQAEYGRRDQVFPGKRMDD
jgi:hypothetical protein